MRFTNCLRSVTTNCKFPNDSKKDLQFVPKHNPVSDKIIKQLENFLMNKPNILVLTGAGISTESGILFIFFYYFLF